MLTWREPNWVRLNRAAECSEAFVKTQIVERGRDRYEAISSAGPFIVFNELFLNSELL
jgi:hypothetical protein